MLVAASLEKDASKTLHALCIAISLEAIAIGWSGPAQALTDGKVRGSAQVERLRRQLRLLGASKSVFVGWMASPYKIEALLLFFPQRAESKTGVRSCVHWVVGICGRFEIQGWGWSTRVVQCSAGADEAGATGEQRESGDSFSR